MDAINKDLRKKFIVSITLTIMFVVGIPSIVLGASNEIWVVMAIGIAFTAAGFYGMPIAWVGYGNTKTLERLVSAVVNENLHTVNELASQFSLSEKEVRDKLDVCFKKGYFVGIKRDGDTLILNENDPLGQKQYAAECPHCGAKFLYTKSSPRCPYCDSPVNEKSNANKQGTQRLLQRKAFFLCHQSVFHVPKGWYKTNKFCRKKVI